ncbi:hypothetical protein CBR_g34124 [Chara braunii]|uniref:Core Histone H2A/H2B/H3 domain-containing protein n=1 Tax=Chara braunii TaxID=69332 RepID=A0A388LI61_CHABU|nr:hypothetical protein CBR_g34124 [Chara braunii]|eukprot:GBG81941.1 hypothetical protein CBR_g34124 [Chara braunii]
MDSWQVQRSQARGQRSTQKFPVCLLRWRAHVVLVASGGALQHRVTWAARAMSRCRRARGKKKKCTSEPPRGQTPAGRKKVNPKAVPATGDTTGARTQVPRHRRRPGMATLSKIRKLQRSTDLCLVFRPFLRLAREVVEEDIAPGMGVRFQMTAVRALMEAVEAYLVANFENTNEVDIHSKRVTIQVRDMRLVDRLSKPRWVEKYQGMCEEGDVDMTMQQKGGTYTPADFKKLLGTVARNGGMLVDGSKDELKSGAAEILVLSRMKDITQTPPEDFQDVPVIVAEGVEYILLDQLLDFMKKSVNDRNAIHEALHEVTEFALQGQDLIEFVPARTEDNIISGRPLWVELLSAALERLGLASCDTATREELVCSDIFNAFTMEKEQCDRGFEEVGLPSCGAEYIDSAKEEDEEEDEGASSSDVEVSGNDVNSDEEDEEHDVYYDLKAAGGQVTKGWAHAILRFTRAFPDPHKVLRVVMKGATPDGALHGVENHPPKAPEKRSQEDGMSKVHRMTKKRIMYKKDKMVEIIDLRASDNMHSAAREKAEEEHDQSISEKSDGEENEATNDEGGDSETSDGHYRDTHDADDEDGRSSDGTAQDEGGDGAGEDDRSADGRGSSPSPERTRRTREPESDGEGGAADAPSIDRQLVRHDNAVKKGKQNVLQLLLLHNDYVVTAQSDDISLMRGCRCDDRTVETGCRISQDSACTIVANRSPAPYSQQDVSKDEGEQNVETERQRSLGRPNLQDDTHKGFPDEEGRRKPWRDPATTGFCRDGSAM